MSAQRLLAAAVAATGLVAAAVVVVVANTAASAATIDPTAFYQVVSRSSGKALDIDQASTADGAPLVQRTPGPGTDQQFQFVSSGGAFFRLRARHSGKVVDVSGRSTADGANVVQWTDNGGTNQQWSVVDTDSGYVKLLNRNSGKALDVWQSSTADGARVSQFTDHNGTNQQWLLVRVTTGGTPTPTSTASPNPTGTPTTPPASYPNPGTVTGNTGVHDPSTVKTPSGGYLLVHTGANLSIKTSSNRTAWQNAGAVFPGGAPWTLQFTGGSNQLWAPDISFHNGQYYLYYAASTFGSRNSAIFLATSPTGASGSWTNQGMVISTTTSDNFNAIDPNLVVDDQGRWWLNFGSFWTGIKLVQLDPATGKRANTTITGIAQRTNPTAVEAPFIFRRGSFYYLWVSFDLCCQGASSTYRVMVGRSTSVTGPYVDRNGTAMTAGGGTQVLAGHGSIHGPGHQAVLADNDANILVYHYYADSGASFLGINRIGYDTAGWPFVY
jgi:arabinan endo-1,5-alpha-L-arabinosidase